MPDKDRLDISATDTISDILKDLPPDRQLIHIIDTLSRQRHRTETIMQDVAAHIRQTGERLGGVESALNKIADIERQMQEDRIRSEKTFERIGNTLDKTSERLVGIETALVELARLDKVEKALQELDAKVEKEVRDIDQKVFNEVRSIEKRISSNEAKNAKQEGGQEWQAKLIWQYLLWGGVFLFSLVNVLFSIWKK